MALASSCRCHSVCTLWGKIKIPSCFLFFSTILFTFTTQWLKEKFNTTIFTPKKCETGIHIHILLLNTHTLKGLKGNWGYSIITYI